MTSNGDLRNTDSPRLRRDPLLRISLINVVNGYTPFSLISELLGTVSGVKILQEEPLDLFQFYDKERDIGLPYSFPSRTRIEQRVGGDRTSKSVPLFQGEGTERDIPLPSSLFRAPRVIHEINKKFWLFRFRVWNSSYPLSSHRRPYRPV